MVFDAVAGDYFAPQYAALAPGGRYVVFGAATFVPSGDSFWDFPKGRPVQGKGSAPTQHTLQWVGKVLAGCRV